MVAGLRGVAVRAPGGPDRVGDSRLPVVLVRAVPGRAVGHVRAVTLVRVVGHVRTAGPGRVVDPGWAADLDRVVAVVAVLVGAPADGLVGRRCGVVGLLVGGPGLGVRVPAIAMRTRSRTGVGLLGPEGMTRIGGIRSAGRCPARGETIGPVDIAGTSAAARVVPARAVG
ncbi:hypothetical protein GCM10010530_77340 [Kribbella aluminosa]